MRENLEVPCPKCRTNMTGFKPIIERIETNHVSGLIMMNETVACPNIKCMSIYKLMFGDFQCNFVLKEHEPLVTDTKPSIIIPSGPHLVS
jgi:hypothetical protein